MPKREREGDDLGMEHPSKIQKKESSASYISRSMQGVSGLFNQFLNFMGAYSPALLIRAIESNDKVEVERISSSEYRPTYTSLSEKSGNVLLSENANLATFRLIIKAYSQEIPLAHKKEALSFFIKKAGSDKMALILDDLGITYSDHPFFQTLFDKPDYVDGGVDAIFEMKEANIHYEDNKLGYILLVANAEESSRLARAFVALKGLNLPYQLNNRFYSKISTAYQCYPELADKIAPSFVALKQANIFYEGNEKLYDLFGQVFPINPMNAIKLATAFVTMKLANLFYKDNSRLYYSICVNAEFGLELAKSFILLNEINIPYQGNEDLYETLIENWTSLDRSFSTFHDELLIAGIEPKKQPEYFCRNVLINIKQAIKTFKKLNALGFSFGSHAFVYNALLAQLGRILPNRQIIKKVISEMAFYVKETPLLPNDSEFFSEQIEDLKSITEEASHSFWSALRLGPLNQSRATLLVKDILKKIVSAKGEVIIDFNALEHYILNIPGEPEINLSLLLGSANLSQLVLGKSMVEKMGRILQPLVGAEWRNFVHHSVVNQQPESEQIAIVIYTTERYRNINKLFRSEPFDLSEGRIFNQDVNKDRLACFLLGCLLNDAVNKLNKYSVQSDKGVNGILDRGERLTEENIKGRLANPWYFPALTSFSVHVNGSSHFHNKGTKRMKLDNPPNYNVINQFEGEVILAQGEQVVTSLASDGEYQISTIVRSPSLERPNNYWSDLALASAYEKYLSREYAEEKSEIVRNGKSIVRPNHNMTHVYRVMLAVDLVLNYFGAHAKDETFKEFCQCIKPEEIEWLRVTAAFSITGRESEMSAGSDLARYDTYRQASMMHFIDFVQKTRADSQTMIDRVAHVVRYMGNPHYAEINHHLDPDERQSRNFYFWILTIAHKLDLPRCYSKNEYIMAMKLCSELSLEGDTQKYNLDTIIRYMIDLTKAHGGRLSCDIGPNGELFNTHTDYQDSYAESSLSMKRLFEMTQTVTKPQPIEIASEENISTAEPPFKRRRLG